MIGTNIGGKTVRLSIPTTLACFIALGAAGARADSLDDAKRAFAEGKVAYDRGDYEQALTLFLRANQLAPAPTLHFNIGNTYEHLGRFREAAAAFDHYLELVGPPKNDEDRRFQENVRARAQANHKRGEQPPPPPPPQQQAPPPPPPQAQPQPLPPAQPSYYQPYPQYGSPYLSPPPLSREERWRQARSKRQKGLSLLITGGVFVALGVTLIAVGVGVHQGPIDSTEPTYYVAQGVEDFFGATFTIVGGIMMIPGGINFAKGQATLKAIEHESGPPVAPGQPRAMTLTAPTLYF
jgi:tetratricopeptide (TPR) repeat protein